jgi:DNA-binding transcriptional regulator YhcF (GntR family)
MIERPASEQSAAAGLVGLGIVIDRDAEVPIGVQMAWALRARIGGGTLTPGQRIPGLRDLAEATGVNINTVRAVYQRLEQDGLIDTHQGSGTFVASTAQRFSEVGRIAASAASAARENGIDPRDVAAALYVSTNSAGRPGDDPERRRLLRMQITALELALGEVEAEYPGAAPRESSTQLGSGPRLLGTEDLERVRSHLVRRVAALQQAIDEQPPPGDPTRPRAEKRKTAKASVASVTAKPTRRPRPTTRPAPTS